MQMSGQMELNRGRRHAGTLGWMDGWMGKSSKNEWTESLPLTPHTHSPDEPAYHKDRLSPMKRHLTFLSRCDDILVCRDVLQDQVQTAV